MSTAARVPETYELEGDDALETLRETSCGSPYATDSCASATPDGFNHSRALALYLGLAVAAQLEAVRAGEPGPLVE